MDAGFKIVTPHSPEVVRPCCGSVVPQTSCSSTVHCIRCAFHRLSARVAYLRTWSLQRTSVSRCEGVGVAVTNGDADIIQVWVSVGVLRLYETAGACPRARQNGAVTVSTVGSKFRASANHGGTDARRLMVTEFGTTLPR